MRHDTPPPPQGPEVRVIALPVKPTLEDRVLKFIEGHNMEIWAAIALLAVLVVMQS